ncbi:glycosyltransferase [Providencia sp. wls1919]|nr:glycosyltransferase [Providencia sp. wls1919]
MHKISHSREKNILVSIIIPAYNVEKYIKKCLTSVLEQTHTNIEVIIINDGSTDNTGNIIDTLLMNEKRAKILHTKNQGVSSARNLGIEKSTGEYLIFVDGDDYLANDYVCYMLDLVETSKSDFCLSKNCFTKKNEPQVKNREITILNSEDATALILSPDLVVGCWNKIYKRNLIVDNKISFSENLFYGEGLTFIIDIALVSKTVGIGNKKVYFYRKNNEDSATTKFDISKIYNGERALIDIKNKLPIGSKKIQAMFNYHLCLYRLGALVQLKSNNLKNYFSTDYNRWLSDIRKNALSFVFNESLSFYRKTLIIFGAITPSIIAKLDQIRRKQIANKSVNG